MHALLDLYANGYLTDEHISAAKSWRDNPVKMFLAPSMFRIMHDAIFKDLGVEAIEHRHGLPGRSAKAILRLILQALYECESIFIRRPEDASDAHRAEIELLRGENVDDLSDLITRFSISPMRAKIFLVLKNAGGRMVTYDTIAQRTWRFSHNGNPPAVSTLKVQICHLRKAISGSEFTIKTVHGIGYSLIEHAKAG